MENKNKYYDIAERIYDLDGEVYECVGSSLGRTFTGDKRTCVESLVKLMRTKPQGHLLRSELAGDMQWKSLDETVCAGYRNTEPVFSGTI